MRKCAIIIFAVITFGAILHAANNTQLASDSFAGAGPGLGANWTASFGTATGQIASHLVEPVSTSVVGSQEYTAVTWPNGQISEVTVQTLSNSGGGTNRINLILRSSNSANTLYTAHFDATGVTNGCTVSVFKVIAGVSTQLGSTTGGITIKSGSVFTFQAAGSLLSVYIDGARVFWIGDASISSGQAGFAVYSTVNIANAQVSAWRGYSNVQQDGVWAKQGIVIPATTAELTGLGNGNPTNVIHESGCLIVSSPCYKIWYGSDNLEYAESSDATTWTPHGTNVITGKGFAGSVIESGGLYHVYVSDSTGASIDHYTSSDGETWTLANSGVLTKGGAGAWDSSYVYYLTPVYIDGGGTWYALYEGASTTPGFQNLGLATSPDGATWTKYVSNPVYNNIGTGVPYKVRSTWYMWGPVQQYARGNSSSYFLPTEMERIQSDDLIHWSNPVHGMHVSQMYEAVNSSVGQALYKTGIDVGGQAYFFGSGVPSDASAPKVYQVALAIAPVPIESLILQPEDAVQPISSDGFTNGTGPLSSNWTVPTGGTAPTIVSGPAVQTSVLNTISEAAWTGTALSNDQCSEITLKTFADTGDFTSPLVRMSLSALTYYQLNMQGPAASLNSAFGIYKHIAGVSTAISPIVKYTPSLGDTMQLCAIGNVISVYQNGGLLLQVMDPLNSIPTGYPGFSVYASTASGSAANSQINAWSGGNANVIPSYVSVSGGRAVIF